MQSPYSSVRRANGLVQTTLPAMWFEVAEKKLENLQAAVAQHFAPLQLRAGPPDTKSYARDCDWTDGHSWSLEALLEAIQAPDMARYGALQIKTLPD
jgi:beta-xylosidase